MIVSTNTPHGSAETMNTHDQLLILVFNLIVLDYFVQTLFVWILVINGTICVIQCYLHPPLTSEPGTPVLVSCFLMSLTVLCQGKFLLYIFYSSIN